MVKRLILVEKAHHQYSVEDFTQDTKFIKWVKKGEDRKYWEDFVRKNPDQLKNIETAREIVGLFKSSEKELHAPEMYAVWKKVEFFHSLYHKNRTRTLGLKKLIQYAAIFIFTLLLGGFGTLFYFSQKNNQFSEIDLSSSDFREAKIILDDGDEVVLKEKQTDLHFNARGDQIKIDQDSVINYKSTAVKDAMTQVIIPFGKRSNIQLSDGTKVWMNAGSKLVFPQKFAGKKRKVFLTGEAYFEVAKDKTRPFVVSTDNMSVTVLGTKFNLRDNASDDELEVVLVEGEVSLKENSVLNMLEKEIKLKPNQRAVYNKLERGTLVESNVDVEYYTSWREGVLMFERESILNVFKRLSRYYNVHFVTEKSVELNRKFSGKLNLKYSLEEVLKVVCDAAPVTYKIENEKVYINSKIPYLPMK